MVSAQTAPTEADQRSYSETTPVPETLGVYLQDAPGLPSHGGALPSLLWVRTAVPPQAGQQHGVPRGAAHLLETNQPAPARTRAG